MKPGGWPSLIPRLFVDEPEAFVEFLKRAFAATGEFEADRPSNVQLRDAVLMIGSTQARAKTASCFYLYVEDVDAVYAAALHAGATSLEGPCEVPWAGRRGIVRDPFGNDWQIATA
jgi:PhnB protein